MHIIAVNHLVCAVFSPSTPLGSIIPYLSQSYVIFFLINQPTTPFPQRSWKSHHSLRLLPVPDTAVLLPPQPLHPQHVPRAARRLGIHSQQTRHPGFPPQCHFPCNYIRLWSGPCCSGPVALEVVK